MTREITFPCQLFHSDKSTSLVSFMYLSSISYIPVFQCSLKTYQFQSFFSFIISSNLYLVRTYLYISYVPVFQCSSKTYQFQSFFFHNQLSSPVILLPEIKTFNFRIHLSAPCTDLSMLNATSHRGLYSSLSFRLIIIIIRFFIKMQVQSIIHIRNSFKICIL